MKSDWMIFRGDGVPRDVSFPPPPRWRSFDVAQDLRGSTFRPSAADIRIVNVALHLRRPLLIEGTPGSGKSSLASAVARELKLGPVLAWPINSRTTLRDGLYHYDAIGRLNHLGWRVGSDSLRDNDDSIEDFIKLGPLGTALLASQKPRVLLIDEIDKSDGDLPNDLLHVLENGWFEIPELERIASRRPKVSVLTNSGADGGPCQTAEIIGGRVLADAFPFIVITSNGERDLPPAFLRRCIRHVMEMPERERLESIISAHLGSEAVKDCSGVLGQFLTDLDQGRQLAIDQLLNAVFLLSGRELSETDRREITGLILQDLGN